MIKADNLYRVINYTKVTNDCSPSFSGIVAGECKGDLWVDDLENPTIAIAHSYAVGGFAFLGDIEFGSATYNAIKIFINEDLFARLMSNGIDYFEFSIESEKLREPILQMFADKTIQSEKEFHYRRREEIPQLLVLPEEYSVHEINDELWNSINKGAIENRALVINRILGSWETIDDFFEKSLAFCIMHCNRIVAVIIGTAAFNNVIAIDIETEEAYRKKGLALVLTEKFVNECVRRGYTAEWDCVESNPASRKLAEKAGFKLLKQNEVYCFTI